jgi:hypothetical protein
MDGAALVTRVGDAGFDIATVGTFHMSELSGNAR